MEVAIGCDPSRTTGASLRQEIEWPVTNWRKAYRTVRRLQMRIVKAINRVLHWAFERLELYEGKLSRTVLRGGGGSNATSLPDNTANHLRNRIRLE